MTSKQKFLALVNEYRELLDRYKKSRWAEIWEFEIGFQDELQEKFNKEIAELEDRLNRLIRTKRKG